MENVRECIKEMQCFVRGGLPGIDRLLHVYKNIFIAFNISSPNDIYFIINSLGIKQKLQAKMLGEMTKTYGSDAKSTLIGEDKKHKKPKKKNHLSQTRLLTTSTGPWKRY
jgi:hypothetical protein